MSAGHLDGRMRLIGTYSLLQQLWPTFQKAWQNVDLLGAYRLVVAIKHRDLVQHRGGRRRGRRNLRMRLSGRST